MEKSSQTGTNAGVILLYLKESAAIICEVFKHSPVFRVGGDEFAVILMNIDYREREELMKLFDQKCREKRSKETESWEQVDVARGMAVYDPDIDETVNKVVHRADQLMYENKRAGKEQQANT